MQTGAVTWTCGGRLSRMRPLCAFQPVGPHVFADLSKNLWDRDSEALLLDLARATGLEAHRNAMFAGEAINTTENRAVLHTLLRRPANVALPGDVPETAQRLADVHSTLNAMLAFAEEVRSDTAITDVVNIGIGGSDLAPHGGAGVGRVPHSFQALPFRLERRWP